MLKTPIEAKEIVNASIDDLDEIVDMVNNYQSLCDDLESCLEMYKRKKSKIEDIKTSINRRIEDLNESIIDIPSFRQQQPILAKIDVLKWVLRKL